MVFLTGAVGLRLMLARMTVLRKNRVHPQALADGSKWDEILRDAENPSDAFENLFEIPVLFYALLLAVSVTQQVDRFYIFGAWAFVFLRVVQAYIHCTYNRITHRAYAYWLGCFFLFAMWIRFGIGLAG